MRVTRSSAVHPFRVTSVDEVPMRLLEDYWYGVRINADNLDSLDPHDIGVRTFHAARRDTVERFFIRCSGPGLTGSAEAATTPTIPSSVCTLGRCDPRPTGAASHSSRCSKKRRMVPVRVRCPRRRGRSRCRAGALSKGSRMVLRRVDLCADGVVVHLGFRQDTREIGAYVSRAVKAQGWSPVATSAPATRAR